MEAMFDDDSRGLEGPDRSDASPSTARVRPDRGERAHGSRSSPARRADGGTSTDAVRERLESIDRLARSLLVDIRLGEPIADLESGDRDARREAVRHVREIRAEATHVGLLLVGPEAAIPSRPVDDPDGESVLLARDGSLTTSYHGPEPGALERERERQCDGTSERE